MKIAFALIAVLVVAGCNKSRDGVVLTTAVVTAYPPEPAPEGPRNEDGSCKLGRYGDGSCVRYHD